MSFVNDWAESALSELKERWDKASALQKIGIAIVVYPVWPTVAILAPFIMPEEAWQATTEFFSVAGTLVSTTVAAVA